MSVAVALREARALLAAGYVKGHVSYARDADGWHQVPDGVPERGAEARWCVDDAVLVAAGGDREAAGECHRLLSDAAAGGSPVMDWDAATGAPVDRPKAEVLKLFDIAARRAAALEAA